LTKNIGRIEVLHNSDNIIHTYIRAVHNTKTKWDYCADIKSSVAFTIEPIRKALLDAKETRKIMLRFVTEITRDTIPYCKQMMKIGKVRHLGGVKGDLGISETEYIATSHIGSEPIITHAIYSNVREDLQQQHYTFEILWKNAIPAEQKIREIEEGYSKGKTQVLYGSENVIDAEVRFFSEAKNRIDTCMDSTRPALAIGIESIRKSFVEAKSKFVQLRYLTEITNDNLSSCKEIIKIVDELRHLDGIKGNFMISESEYLAPITSDEKTASLIIFSNVKEILEHQQYVFDTFWNKAIPAEQRITEIEEGADRTGIEVIPNSNRVREMYLKLMKNAEKEIILMFPTTNAFNRQERIGVFEYSKGLNIKVRILVPSHKSTEQILENLRKLHSNFNVRYIEQTPGTQATFLVVDRKVSLVMEIRDDSKTTFDEAIGLSTYSNSDAGVLSYVAIFENLWKQTEIYEDIKKAHEQLKLYSKAQKEFINVAAHGLRTPIQPILGLSHLLLSKTGSIEQYNELLETINRNAKRLNRLSDDILDVTKIEGKSLQLKKERFNLNDMIINAMDDIILGKSKNIQLLYEPLDIELEADKGRISQVISNLLSNAIKFTEKGTITIAAKIEEGNSHILISVKDTGTGIDPEALPELFSKFMTKSFSGVGLGLFISKSIVEAHGGKIWAENNSDGNGTTFKFSLPLRLEATV
jgi:two-component system sensor histidine kinase VicK